MQNTTKVNYEMPEHKRQLIQAVLEGKAIEYHGGTNNRVITDVDEALGAILESSLGYLKEHVRVKPDTVFINEKEVPKPVALHVFAPEDDSKTLSIWCNGWHYCALEYSTMDDVLVVASAMTKAAKGE
jgi:hypothetical protein